LHRLIKSRNIQYKDQLPSEKDAKIVVYCLVGHMGNIAAEKLHRMGYSDVVNLQGGMKAWGKKWKHVAI
jgi:rhodanese-related sulfurtransferase